KCLALFWRGPLIDDRLQLAIAFMQRSGKIDSCRKNETVQPGTLEMSLIDPHRDQALARAVSRHSIEIARTAEPAIAGPDPFAFQTPVRCRHGRPPSRCQLSARRCGRLNIPFSVKYCLGQFGQRRHGCAELLSDQPTAMCHPAPKTLPANVLNVQ